MKYYVVMSEPRLTEREREREEIYFEKMHSIKTKQSFKIPKGKIKLKAS